MTRSTFFITTTSSWGDQEALAGVRDHWARTGIFEAVELCGLWVEETIFDAYDTFEHAKLAASCLSLLGDHAAAMANEVVLRLQALEPDLLNKLHAALETAESAVTAERRAHVALSLRRLLEGLADALFPAQSEPFGGRDVGNDKYINRLWAYVSAKSAGTEGKVAKATLEDVGARIDRMNDLVNKGLDNEINMAVLQRLVIGVMALMYDLLLIEAPLSRNDKLTSASGRRADAQDDPRC